jgi:hypothetical protein
MIDDSKKHTCLKKVCGKIKGKEWMMRDKKVDKK